MVSGLATVAATRQTMVCQALGVTVRGTSISWEIGTLADCFIGREPLFSYTRYDPYLAETADVHERTGQSGFKSGRDYQEWLTDISQNRIRRAFDFPRMAQLGKELADGDVAESDLPHTLELDLER